MRKWFPILMLVTSCLSPSDIGVPLNLGNNRASLPFVVGGVTYGGVASLPSTGATIRFLLPEGTVLFQLDNCAREHVKIRPSGREYSYTYVPSAGELGSCLMQAQATTFKGESLTAVIDYRDSGTLKAAMWCNEGLNSQEQGRAICQNRATKLMWLKFSEPVIWAAGEGCSEPRPSRGMLEIKVTQGLCAYGFITKSKEVFALTTYGYTTLKEVNLNVGSN